MKIHLYLPVIATLAFTLNTYAQEKKLIRPVFTPEKQFEFTTTLKKDLYENKKLSTRQFFEYNFLLTVLSKDTGETIILRATYKGIHFIIDNKKEGKIQGFDSQYPDSIISKGKNKGSMANENGYLQFNRAMLDQSFTIYLNRKGTIDKVTGVDSVSDYALTKVTGMEEEYMQGFRAGIKSSNENEDAKGTFQKAFDYITPKPAGVGESWVRSGTTDIGDINVNYTLKAAMGDSLQVFVAANVLNQKYKMTINKSGIFTVDAQSGLLRNARIREEIVSTAANPNQIRMNTSENYTLLMK